MRKLQEGGAQSLPHQRGAERLGVSHRIPRTRLALAFGSLTLGAFAAWNVDGPSGGSASVALLGASMLLATQTKPAVLNHPTRARIYAHLTMLPGDHFRSIVRSLGLGVGEVRHHLNVLLHSGVVREDKTDRRCRYYVRVNADEVERNQLFARHWGYRDVRMRVLFAVRSLGDAKPSTVAASLGISRQLAAYHLRCLEALGLVHRAGRAYRA